MSSPLDRSNEVVDRRISCSLLALVVIAAWWGLLGFPGLLY